MHRGRAAILAPYWRKSVGNTAPIAPSDRDVGQRSGFFRTVGGRAIDDALARRCTAVVVEVGALCAARSGRRAATEVHGVLEERHTRTVANGGRAGGTRGARQGLLRAGAAEQRTEVPRHLGVDRTTCTCGELAVRIERALHGFDRGRVEAVRADAARDHGARALPLLGRDGCSVARIGGVVAARARAEVFESRRQVVDDRRIREVSLTGVMHRQGVDRGALTVHAAQQLALGARLALLDAKRAHLRVDRLRARVRSRAPGLRPANAGAPRKHGNEALIRTRVGVHRDFEGVTHGIAARDTTRVGSVHLRAQHDTGAHVAGGRKI